MAAVIFKQRRPRWVWVITLFNVIGIAFTTFSFIAVWTGLIPIEPASREYLSQLGVLEWFGSAALLFLSAAATSALFSLRSIAAPLFTAALTINIAWSYFIEPIPPSLGETIGLAISVAITSYAWHLRRTGVLVPGNAGIAG